MECILCNTTDIPEDAFFCPECGHSFLKGKLEYVPYLQRNSLAVNICKEYIESNRYKAKDTICDLLSLSHQASVKDIQDAIEEILS